VVTAAGVASLLVTVPRLKRTVQNLSKKRLPADDNAQGTVGLLLFVGGIVDMVLTVKNCVDLYTCRGLAEHLMLFGCLVCSTAATAVATVFLGCCTLAQTKADANTETRAPLMGGPADGSREFDGARDTGDTAASSGSAISQALTDLSETTEWMLRDKCKLPLVLLCSLTRLQSLAILRLELCCKDKEDPSRKRRWLDYPMRDEHLHFLRNCGLYRILCADIPIALVAFVLVHASPTDSSSDSQAMCGDLTLVWAETMLWCKIVLLAWGTTNSAAQLLLTGQCGTGARGSAGADGVLEVQTVASVLRSTAGTLRSTPARLTSEQRTDRWVQDHGSSRQPPSGLGGSE